jgi:hypothetical protein
VTSPHQTKNAVALTCYPLFPSNGEMKGGFALVAFPAEYRNSGVMTFIVNEDGVVHEKDLGEQTAQIASQMTQYNPDSSWRKSR